ncbi:MAG: hypothetical protein JSV30_06660 [Candidatus Omnitrophota bacterium]|nr:MAG: hypothetical protein JSV30_06660 [Candidatus Omnitrophota bacterium]
MPKLRYEVDPHNRLVVSGTDKKLPLGRFRRVFDGRFKIGPGNTLIYHIKGPMYGLGPEEKTPHQVKLRGKWALTKNHDLVLTLDKWRRQRIGDELTLQGEVIAAEASSLLFAVTTRSEKDLASTYLLKLQGIWQADEHNRLIFRVKRGQGRHDTLIFEGIWEINKHHRIIYHYKKAQLTRKKTLDKTITFKGYWDIVRRNRLSYNLSLDNKSGFDFKTGLGRLDKGYIKYEIGIGVTPVRRIVILFGKWKIKKNTGLLFEIEYEKGKPQAIIFGAEARLTKQDKIEFKLKNIFHKDLGMELKLSRRLIKGDGEAFLKLLRDKEEVSVYVGGAWRW